jgi:hypothetical protein
VTFAVGRKCWLSHESRPVFRLFVQLFLRGGTVTIVDESKHKKPWCFEVRSGGSALIAQATNAEERDAWVTALQTETNRAPQCEGIITIAFKGHKVRSRVCRATGRWNRTCGVVGLSLHGSCEGLPCTSTHTPLIRVEIVWDS